MTYTFRRLFATILIYNSPSNPQGLWNDFCRELSDDYLMDQNQTEDEAFLKALQSIDLFMQQNGRNIDEFNLVSFKVGATREEMFAREYEHERTIQVSHNDIQSINQLNDRQQEAFDRITASLNMEIEDSSLLTARVGQVRLICTVHY